MKKVFLALILSIGFLNVALSSPVIGDVQVGGGDIPNQQSKLSEENATLITNLYQWINQVAGNPEKITVKELNKYFTSNIAYSVNGIQLASNTEQLAARFKLLVSKEKSMQVILPLDNIVVANDYVAISYRIKITTKNDVKYDDTVTAILKFSNGKISNWHAVIAHMKEITG